MIYFVNAALIVLDAMLGAWLLAGWAGVGILYVLSLCWLFYELATAPTL